MFVSYFVFMYVGTYKYMYVGSYVQRYKCMLDYMFGKYILMQVLMCVCMDGSMYSSMSLYIRVFDWILSIMYYPYINKTSSVEYKHIWKPLRGRGI